MEENNKIIESLTVKFVKATHIKILQPVTVANFYDVENTLLLVNKGQISYGPNNTILREGEMVYIPSGRAVSISYGKNPTIRLNNDDLFQQMEKFFTSQPLDKPFEDGEEGFSYITFNANVFDSVNFFQSLDIPAFSIEGNKKLRQIIYDLIRETTSQEPGKERVIAIETDRIVVEVMRYILKNRLFVEQLATNTSYFKDPRLLDIFAFIKEHLEGDLSNKVLANVANVSEDYVGQYFKMLTGINPQDYIEYQRMEKAVNLLRTTKRSIREIGREVGYKDTAYFCRRFKMMFGIPAGKMRRRESLMNI